MRKASIILPLLVGGFVFLYGTVVYLTVPTLNPLIVLLGSLATSCIGAAVGAQFVLRRWMIQSAADPLTGLYTRRVGDELLLHALRRVQRSNYVSQINGSLKKTILAVFYIDVNRFKNINDRWGHRIGDKALVMVANALLQSFLRRDDVLVRWGGDEFIAAVEFEEGQERNGTQEILKRLLSCLEKGIEISLDPLAVLKVTLSIGVAFSKPEENYINALIDRADKAMYGAKRKGGNQSVIAD